MKDEYREQFNTAGDHLRQIAYRLKGNLDPVDVTGIMFAVAIQFLRDHDGDELATQWLRDLADSIERGECGLKRH